MAEPKTTQQAAPGSSAAALLRLETLTKRQQFLATARARRVSLPAFTLQARKRPGHACGEHVGIGYTCSKKVGNAVARNRAKRRLREIARLVLPEAGQPGYDYVLIGRATTTADRDFTALVEDLKVALRKVHQ